VDTIATSINILGKEVRARNDLILSEASYKVVALRVNVKLVEKMAKSHDGKVRVVNAITQ
jgi:phage-related protein